VVDMPQITCPNCGKTINLEARRQTDFEMIKSAAHVKPCTFTDFLNATKLPRKTLSLRLKQMCSSGILIKTNGLYHVDATCKIKENFAFRRPRVFDNRKVRTIFMLVLFIVSFSSSGYVLAMFIVGSQKNENLTQTILGNFSVTLNINEVNNLWAWQVAIEFNPRELTVINVSSGDFFRVGELFPNILSDTLSNRLLIGNCLYPNQTAKSGSGSLATIVFGYFVQNYTFPKIVHTSFDGFKTYLLDPEGSTIDLGPQTLVLQKID